MNIFINTTVDAFLGSTIPYYAREHGNVFAARKCYATAVLLFQENKITQKQAICMFDKVLELSPNFSDADQFRQEIWHRILRTRSMSPEYPNYLKSPAWHTKKAQVLERDGYRCALCNTEDDLEVHHRNYDNIGKEPLSDLTSLCRSCHQRYENDKQELSLGSHETIPTRSQPCDIHKQQLPRESPSFGNTGNATPPSIPASPPPAPEEPNDEERGEVPFELPTTAIPI